jgi:hypothetical protein
MKHNKKRNVGLIYELLTKHITKCVMNDNKIEARKVLRIIENRFNKSNELYKEFRIFQAIYNSTVSNTTVAVGVLTEAKNGIRSLDRQKLQKEKSLLIRDINYQLKNENFYNQKVDDYRLYASIQSLINTWSEGTSADLSKLIKLEKIVLEHLIDEDKKIINEIVLDERSDNLVFKILAEKLNEKYNKALTQEQKSIVRNYAVYFDDKDSLSIYLNNIKTKTKRCLKE